MKFFTLSIFAILVSFLFQAEGQPSQWISKGVGGGGSFFQPSINPNNNNDIFVTSDMSELFHSTDFSGSWSMIDFRQFWGGSNTGKVQFILGGTSMYAINFKDESSIPAKSTDDGATWVNLPNDPTGGGAYGYFVDPNNENRMIISDYNNVSFTTNAGTSWTQVYSASGCLLAGAFFDGSTIFVGTNFGILTSANGGGSFTMQTTPGIPQGEAIVSFTGARAGSVVRFMCVTLGTGDVYPGVTGSEHSNFKGLYTFDAGASSWVSRTAGVPQGAQPVFISLSLNSVDTAFAAGGSASGVPVVLRTVNSGVAWTNTFQTTNNQNISTGWVGDGGDGNWGYPEYAFGLAVGINNPRRLIMTDMGCVHVSSDGGASWKQAYLSTADQNPPSAHTPVGKPYAGIGLENTSCWSVCWVSPDSLIAGFTDIKGIITTNGGAKWSFGYTGHTLNTMYQAIKHPSTNVFYAATSSVHDMYQSTYLTDARIDGGQGKVLFSVNSGITWQTLHDFGHPVIWLVADPHAVNRMYASVIHSSAGGIYVSNNIQNGSGSTWTKLAAPPRTQGHPFNIVILNDGTLVCTYSGRRTTSAFTNSSGVFISTDNGSTWIDRSSPQMNYWTKDIVVDPHDQTQNTWYVGVFNGWGGPPNGLGGLYKTTNRGLAWNKILVADAVTSCTLHPQNPDIMYVTTEHQGLFYSSNASQGTPSFTQVASYPFKQPERVFFNPYNTDEVWIASFGGGMYVGNSNPVPVQLQRFEAVADMNSALLQWTTASETNNHGFEVQRQSDAAAFQDSWTSIGFVNGNGTSADMHAYTFHDYSVAEGQEYRYRLLQIDNDGSSRTSAVQSVVIPVSVSSFQLKNHPNPFSFGTSFEFTLAGDGYTSLEIYNILGRQVATVHSGYLARGRQVIDWRNVGLSAGIYFADLRQGGRSTKQMFIIDK